MVRYIVDLNEFVFNFLITKQLIKSSQPAYFQLVQAFNYLNFIEIIIQEGIIDNETILKILHKEYRLPLITSVSDITILDYLIIDEYIKNGYFRYKDCNGIEYIAVNNLKLLPKLLSLEEKIKIKLVNKRDFYSLVEQNFRHLNIIKSKYFLEFISKSKTAKNVNYPKVLSGFLIVFFFTFFKFINIFYIINNISYFLQNCLKIFLFKRSLINIDTNHIETKNLILPIYTILIPLYKEIGKLKFIINNINALNYPKHKLDVKIIVEEDDYSMIKEIVILDLPNYFQIIKVPFSLPRTKPKALNYAMQYVYGRYLVVYDAEDRPDPDQLLKAIILFQNLPLKYACLQAKLNFYNRDENLLTKFFSIEYHLGSVRYFV